jgi:hypothetical protein
VDFILRILSGDVISEGKAAASISRRRNLLYLDELFVYFTQRDGKILIHFPKASSKEKTHHSTMKKTHQNVSSR